MPLQNEDSPHLGKIAGPMLGKRLREGVDDLARDGVDLAFETDLLYFDVNSNKIGIRDAAPSKEFRIQGTGITTDLIVDTKISNDDLEIRSDGSITTPSSSLFLTATNYIVSSNIRTDDVNFDNNILSTLSSNRTLELRPTGSLDIYNNLNVTGDLYATGDITLDGNITFGNNDDDSIGLLADVNSDINPDVSNTYSLGRNGRIWSELRTVLVNGEQLESGGLFIGDLDIVLRQGKIWYVAQNGLDTNEGDHQNGPFRTIKHALSQATSGDTVYIYPGEYSEDLPLTVPVGVTVTGVDIRNVIIEPDTDTQSQDVFLLNGETTVSNLTIRNFYYDSVNDTGYAFRFAPNFKVTTRSPYIQNVTVKTKGSATSLADPRGFDSGDAGRGALIDGSVATTDTKEASMLFHSCTFITPNADCITMTNGVRVEWLNSFTYFANRGLYALRGTGRLTEDGSTLRYGAEIRSIGSASVYGNYGAWADGEDTLMYLINHNFGYIGTGKDENNDPSLRIQANETVELGLGKIYYQSMDHEGDFRVGDVFNIDAQTGFISINGFSTSGESSSITFGGLTSETRIDATEVTTGNIRFRQNILSSLSGDVTLKSATGVVNLTQDVNVYKNLDIIGDTNIDGRLTIGNQNFDIAEFAADVEFDLRPHIDDEYTLGNDTKRWDTIFLRTSAFVDSDIEINSNEIRTLTSNTDLIFTANGSGRIYVPTNDVEIENDLTVDTDTTTTNINILGLLDHTGNKQQLGSTDILGNIDLTGSLTINGNAYYQNIDIINNILTTSDSNSDLELVANGSGIIHITTTDVEIDTDLTVGQNITTNSVIADSVITANSITNTNIDIYDNIIVTTVSNSDLELSANGTGRIYVSTNDVEIENDLTVNTDSDLNSVFILGTIYQTGNSNRTGNSTQTGSTDISQTLDVDQTAYFEEITILENKIYTNTLDTDLELVANGTGVILLSKPVAIDQELSVLGTTYTSAISNSNTITSDQFFNNDISITDNVLTTTISNSDLVLSASGNLINIQNSNIQLTQNLDVNGTSTLLTTDVTGLIQQTGNTVRTGSVNLTGNISVTNLTVTNGIQFENIDFDNNVITTTVTNDDLQLEANGTGRIYIPTNNVEVDQNLTVNTILYTENINNDQEISSDKFLTNKIEIRNDYIETTSTDNLRFLASNNVVVEDVTFDSNRIRTNTLNSNLEITPGTDKNLILNSNKSLLVARGTTANKLTLETGDLRFNTSDNLFEGFSTGRRTIGGVYSANRNTFINLNSLTNTITFTIGAAAVLDITENRLRTDELRIDNLISLNDNTISNNTGTDLLLTPNGTGSIVAGSWSFTDNDISNNSLTDKLTFVSSADGYLKFHGDAIGIPSGTSSERPLSPDVGDIRLNTEDEQVEVFNGASYNPITGTGEVATEELVRELGDLWTLVLG